MRFLILIIAVNVVLFSGLRLGFWVAFHGIDSPLPIDMLSKSFFVGFKLDLRLALLLMLPILLLFRIPSLNPVHSPRARNFWFGHLCLLMILTVFFYITDFGNFAYLQERIDVSALRYLENRPEIPGKSPDFRQHGLGKLSCCLGGVRVDPIRHRLLLAGETDNVEMYGRRI